MGRISIYTQPSCVLRQRRTPSRQRRTPSGRRRTPSGRRKNWLLARRNSDGSRKNDVVQLKQTWFAKLKGRRIEAEGRHAAEAQIAKLQEQLRLLAPDSPYT
ncbi:hypothetical protein BS47DRAFT_364125 [Hydnum rufescens UP504]|uniref:Uncharacterized protein n=1 Tax=Hydnum rufescens UP504 TaxID=1448309 RepID=A0A9P6AJW7_9AGAM|nr:hypothetical protein BS47DRAFT_364125 [Hydnum rufescens UP504]